MNKEVGELFKNRRNERNMTLKEAENGTSIRMSYLNAIEEGKVGTMIPGVYAQGFVKQYAAFLGLDGEEIMRKHPEILKHPQAQEFSYGIGTLEIRGNPVSGVKWLPNALWAGAFVLLLLVAWYAARLLEVI